VILGQRIRLDLNNVQATFFELRQMTAAYAVTACRQGSSGREPSPTKLPLGQEEGSYCVNL